MFGFPLGERAVLIGKMLEDTPASRAGLREGDIILEIDGRRMRTASELIKIIGLTPPGRKVEVKIFRDQEEKILTLETGERPCPRGEIINDLDVWRGIRVQELTEELAEELGLAPEEEGVLISEVEAGSPAEEAGLRPGDIIKEIARIEIKSLNDFQEALRGIRVGEDALIRTARGFTIVRGEE